MATVKDNRSLSFCTGLYPTSDNCGRAQPCVAVSPVSEGCHDANRVDGTITRTRERRTNTNVSGESNSLAHLLSPPLWKIALRVKKCRTLFAVEEFIFKTRLMQIVNI